MFPNYGSVPKLRFSEFSDEWENKKLGDLMTFKVTNSYSRDNLNYESGIVKNIHYGDIHTKFQTLFDLEKENVPYINEDISLNRISKDFYCQEGDVIFADASEDLNDVGKSIEITNLNGEKLLSGLHTLLARPQKNNFSKGFLGYLLKSDFVRNQIKREAQGSKVLSINVGRICNIYLSFPSISEQKKISEFLSLLDKRILCSKKIIEQLETLMSNLKDFLFEQQLRFKDEKGNKFPNWQKVKLENICEKQSSSISANKIEDNYGDYPIYSATGILKQINFYEVENDYISIIKDGAGVGRLHYCKGKSSVLGTLDIIKSKNVNLYFLFLILSRINFKKYITGSTIPHIYFKDYKNEKFKIPSLEEQDEIVNFFRRLDDKINLEKELLAQYENQKKYLLQNLFV
ncbi:restriction endonuclease subunit S [Chryseobacterium binzhouense]|uniref:restriction endonuclease subunit S n=1 Tax=Chryseobacterium binzhouense TaxID=2593646 RepID=UPI001E3FDF57|nr:restriction endonuclease subunit S [Chryseobacterium binzhouense]